ncbi:MAG: chemotaxis response regulator protein-glutamate methylesterase [Candidatus Kapabacteria bacterium]|nr:chemotaxis response regulator protein-glutamate methylesterase [Candidatus Kapabacteria bacterium]
MADKIRVLVVDDSSFLRTAISKFLTNEETEVVGTASNGREAVQKAKELKPDVITMDIEMPEMNGLEALKIIMKEIPTPVIMISTLTKEGADSTIEALSLGAVDFIAKKPAFSEVQGMKSEIVDKVTKIGKENKNNQKRNTSFSLTSPRNNDLTNKPSINLNEAKKSPFISRTIGSKNKPNPNDIKIICIGISTGGPITLQHVIPYLSKSFPVPILIVQHMPPMFTKSLANRLDSLSELKVEEAKDGDRLIQGMVYIAPGGMQMRVNRFGKIVVNNIKPEAEIYEPSFNVLLESAIQAYGKGVLGVIMTGMGSDGTNLLSDLSKLGGYVIAQDPTTCIAYGMPSSAIKANVVDEIVSLDNIAQAICNVFKIKTISK